MRITSEAAEHNTVLSVAEAMAAAARTAPKTKGQDFIETLILTEEDLNLLADTMEELGTEHSQDFLIRDAGNVRNSTAVLLLGIGHHCRGLNELCQFCGSENCTACAQANGSCAFDPMDLGIAIGSAVSVAASFHIDNRVMFSAGVAARKLQMFTEDITIVIGIPLSVSGKSIYFDRKPKK